MTDILQIAALSPALILCLAALFGEIFEFFRAIDEQYRRNRNKSGQYWNNLGKI